MISTSGPLSCWSAGAGIVDDCSPERPERVVGDPKRRDAERDRDDQDEADDAGDGIADCQPPAGEHQPDHVEHYLHGAKYAGRR